jgi:predicted transcriptional regulator
MPDDKNVSPAAVQKYLKGVEYPSTKDDLLDVAMENEAPEEIIDKIEQLPSSEFKGQQDVMKALGQME